MHCFLFEGTRNEIERKKQLQKKNKVAVVDYSATFYFEWRRLTANFHPYFSSILSFVCFFFFPPVFHSQELACQTDSFLMNCLVEKRRNLWQAAAWIHRGAEGCSCSLWGRRGPPPPWCWGRCQLELRGALGHTNSPSMFCKRQWVCCVVLVQRARYLFKVLFVELEKRQAPEEGRNLEVFCSFFFF